jgi:protein CpxP
MNSRKATIILAALLSTGAIFAQAQAAPADQAAAAQSQTQQNPAAGKHGRMNPNRQVKFLTKKLNLSADQAAQLKPILEDRAQQMQALQADTALAPADRRTKAQGIQADSNTKIEAVLNDQQKQQFEQMLAERKAKRQQKNQQPGA